MIFWTILQIPAKIWKNKCLNCPDVLQFHTQRPPFLDLSPNDPLFLQENCHWFFLFFFWERERNDRYFTKKEKGTCFILCHYRGTQRVDFIKDVVQHYITCQTKVKTNIWLIWSLFRSSRLKVYSVILTIFLWHESEDTQKNLVSKISVDFNFTNLLVTHDYVVFHWSIDYCVELILVDNNLCENCSNFTLKWFQLK